MSETIKNLTGIELGKMAGEYYLFFTSETLQESTKIRLQGATPQSTERKVLEAWIEEQLTKNKTE